MINPPSDEMARKEAWVSARLRAAKGSELPFSFVYGGQPSAELLPTWPLQHSTRSLDDQREEHTLSFQDPRTGLLVRCVSVEYLDYPTVEWTIYFRNTGPADTPIIENIQAVDVVLERRGKGNFILHHHTGSLCSLSDYQPFRTTLYPPSTPWLSPSRKRITTSGGRPTNSDLPYFNVENEGDGQGTIVVVGWPGQWAADFVREGDAELRVRAGQELTHFRLHPGEEVRGPLVVLQFWEGDRLRSQNIWRRWMIVHNLPRPGGKLVAPQTASGSGAWTQEVCKGTEENQIEFINGYLREHIPIEIWWMDAGWYPQNGVWWNVGTWEVDRNRFPRGLRPVNDHAHAHGMRACVWFEPERATPGTWMYENHPEWLLPPPRPAKPGGWVNYLLDLGNPEAWRWLVEHVDHMLTEEAIDIYRQDFNMDPLEYWRANDAEDRQGITEIRHMMGYLAYWDELRRRHPNLLIDTCASGGRRNDLETLRRSVPFLRSDYAYVPVADQCHTYGIASWIPYYGATMMQDDPALIPYTFWSTQCPHFTFGWDVRLTDRPYELARQLFAQRARVAHCLLGDYYPLTSYSLENDTWLAWQFDRPDLGEGLVQAFRREESPFELGCFRLHGLVPDAQYVLTDPDGGQLGQMVGRELMEKGLPIAIPQQPGAAVVMYRRF